MKVVTLRGTLEVDLQKMQVAFVGSSRLEQLKEVPTPIIGERMKLVTVDGESTTEQVTEVQL